MINLDGRSALAIIGIICFVLSAFGIPAGVNLFALGWAFVVAAWLSGNG